MSKMQSNFIKITLQHGCSPVNLLHIFRTPFPKNTSGGLSLSFAIFVPDVPDSVIGPYFFPNTVLELNSRRWYWYLIKVKFFF